MDAILGPRQSSIVSCWLLATLRRQLGCSYPHRDFFRGRCSLVLGAIAAAAGTGTVGAAPGAVAEAAAAMSARMSSANGSYAGAATVAAPRLLRRSSTCHAQRHSHSQFIMTSSAMQTSVSFLFFFLVATCQGMPNEIWTHLDRRRQQ